MCSAPVFLRRECVLESMAFLVNSEELKLIPTGPNLLFPAPRFIFRRADFQLFSTNPPHDHWGFRTDLRPTPFQEFCTNSRENDKSWVSAPTKGLSLVAENNHAWTWVRRTPCWSLQWTSFQAGHSLHGRCRCQSQTANHFTCINAVS